MYWNASYLKLELQLLNNEVFDDALIYFYISIYF